MLASGAGVIVPFDDPDALSAAVSGLLDDPERLDRARRAARAVGRELTWPQVGRQTAEVLREAITLGPPSTVRRPAPTTLPRARTSPLLTLVDDVGSIQHADGIAPARASGYCTDNIARSARWWGPSRRPRCSSPGGSCCARCARARAPARSPRLLRWTSVLASCAEQTPSPP